MRENRLNDFTPEERAANLLKAREAREAKKEANEHLRNDFLDEKHWRELASRAGFRLPATYVPSSEVKYIKRLLKHLGRDVEWWLERTGYRKLQEFSEMNPDWPMVACLGLILEDHFDENDAGTISKDS